MRNKYYVGKTVGHSISQSVSLVSIVRWRNPPQALLLFFFSGRAGLGSADTLTLPFGFTVEAGAASPLRFALLFVGGGEGGGISSISSSSTSPEFPPAPSSSPDTDDLSDELVSAEESLDSGVFGATLAP
jgi:hypothetical protein